MQMNLDYRRYAFASFSAVPPPAPTRVDTVVFDLGGVLIDWNPRHLYRTLFDDEARMERFLAEVCSPAWNDAQDRGRDWREAVDGLSATFPDERARIAAFDARWPETLGGALEGTVALLDALRREAGVRLFALTNWSQSKFPLARERFDFLQWFEGIVVSGEEGMAKPDAAIFERTCQRFGLVPARTLFIDDAPRNVEAARALGWQAVRFESPAQLADALRAYGLLAR